MRALKCNCELPGCLTCYNRAAKRRSLLAPPRRAHPPKKRREGQIDKWEVQSPYASLMGAARARGFGVGIPYAD
jgi:hypothetical protein